MPSSEAVRAAPARADGDPLESVQLGSASSSDTTLSRPKTPPSRPPTAKQVARDQTQTLKDREKFRREIAAKTAAAPPKPTLSPPATPAVRRTAPVEPGERVGSWTVISADPSAKRAVCACACGAVRQVGFKALATGESESCGCAPRSQAQMDRHRREAAQHPRLLVDWRPGR